VERKEWNETWNNMSGGKEWTGWKQDKNYERRK
jgi:hypothetical protein